RHQPGDLAARFQTKTRAHREAWVATFARTPFNVVVALTQLRCNRCHKQVLDTLMTTARAWPRNSLDAQLVANAAHALYLREGRWPSDHVGRSVRRLAERSYVTMKSADYILVAGFERPDIFEMVASATAAPDAGCVPAATGRDRPYSLSGWLRPPTVLERPEPDDKTFPRQGTCVVLGASARRHLLRGAIGLHRAVHAPEHQGSGGHRLEVRRRAGPGVPRRDQAARARELRPELPARPARLPLSVRPHAQKARGGVPGAPRERADEGRRRDRRARGMGRGARTARRVARLRGRARGSRDPRHRRAQSRRGSARRRRWQARLVGRRVELFSSSSSQRFKSARPCRSIATLRRRRASA